MSAAAYDLLGGHFEFEQEAPPYLPNAPPPIYKPKSVCRTVAPVSPPLMHWPSQCAPHDHHLSAVGGGGLSPGAGPDGASKFPFPQSKFPSALLSLQTLMSLGRLYRVIGV
jgi:hypothetical protein